MIFIKEDNYVAKAEIELGELVMHDWEFEETDGGNYRLLDKDFESKSNLFDESPSYRNKF